MNLILSLREITPIFRKYFGGEISKIENHNMKKGHALMESTLKSKELLIDSGASNHMMAEKDSFSSLETGKSIPIHMGDDYTIISEGQGIADLEMVFSLMFCMYRL